MFAPITVNVLKHWSIGQGLFDSFENVAANEFPQSWFSSDFIVVSGTG